MILIILFIAMAFAFYGMQKSRVIRENRRERMREKQQELLDLLSGRKDVEKGTNS